MKSILAALFLVATLVVGCSRGDCQDFGFAYPRASFGFAYPRLTTRVVPMVAGPTFYSETCPGGICPTPLWIESTGPIPATIGPMSCPGGLCPTPSARPVYRPRVFYWRR